MQSLNAYAPMPAGVEPVVVVSGLDFEAAIAAGPEVVVLCGIGSPRLSARLEALVEAGCRGILSFGTAGGLGPALAPGACVLADRVVCVAAQGQVAASYAVDASWLAALRAALPEAYCGALAGVEQPLASVEAKHGLWQATGALAVDMESHRAAEIAQRAGIPFAACRVVVDPAQRSLPSSATVGLREDGSKALWPILAMLARHPTQLAALLRLAGDANAAKRTLRLARQRAGVAFGLPA